MSNERMKMIGKSIGVAAIIAACGALALGGYTVMHGAGQGAEASSVSVIGTPTPAPVQDTTSALAFHESEVSQMRADDLAAQAAAKAAADKAAADAASAAAAVAPKAVASGPITCPAGSTVQGYDDNNNATACIPSICMNGIGGPGQPTNEQCVVFKP